MPEQLPTTLVAPLDPASNRGISADLVRQILTFSRNEAAMRSPLHLDDLVQEAARLVLGLAQDTVIP